MLLYKRNYSKLTLSTWSYMQKTNLTKCREGPCDGLHSQSKGSDNAHSRFMFEKPELRLDHDTPSGSFTTKHRTRTLPYLHLKAICKIRNSTQDEIISCVIKAEIIILVPNLECKPHSTQKMKTGRNENQP